MDLTYFHAHSRQTNIFTAKIVKRMSLTVCGADCQTPCVFKNKTNFCSSIHMEKSVIFGDPDSKFKETNLYLTTCHVQVHTVYSVPMAT